VSLRTWFYIINPIVLIGLGIYAWTVVRRTPETKDPENLTPFLKDEDLEGRRLERVLGWALFFAAIVAVALPLYWLREPDRQHSSEEYFTDGSKERGEVLFSNAAMPKFNAAVSLQCANCHGSDGGGSTVQTTYDPDGDGPKPLQQVVWRAPALNTVLLRFSPEEVHDIITYGRPGTPMQAWGVPGGGPKNEQAISDLLAYIESIQLTPEKAKQQAQVALEAARTQAQDAIEKTDKDGNKSGATVDLQTAIDDQKKAEANLKKVLADPKATPKDKELAQQAVDDAPAKVQAARDRLAWAQAWAKLREGVSDGQLLFEINCARCHTKGWSVFDPTQVNGTDVLGPPGGGGTQGFNLRNGSEISRFGPGNDPKEGGLASQIDFVKLGSENQKPYGILGIGSGRMPGFGSMLTDQMIQQIVEYERNGIDDTSYDVDYTPSSGSNASTTTTTTTGG
jgi:mono/diheme cytochrome c family protein